MNEKAFDHLINELVRIYELTDREHAAAVVATRILHLPIDQCTTSLEYLYRCIVKNVAYQVATSQLSKLKHQIQIDQLVSQLKENPMDQQSLDALEKAANEGSHQAKEALRQLFDADSPPDLSKIIPINGEDTALPVVPPDQAG